MADTRLEHAKTRLEAYYAAELAVLSGQEYRIGSRSMRRADLSEIREAISSLESLVTDLEAKAAGKGARRVLSVIPRDF